MAFRQGGQRAEFGVFQTLRLHIPIGQLFAHIGVFKRRAGFQFRFTGQFQQLGIIDAAALTNGQTLIHQRRQRDFPALTDIAKALTVGHAHVIEEHFVEAAAARDLFNRTDFNARRLHVEEEKGQTFMLRNGRVGTGDNNAVITKMRARGPDFLTVDNPVIAVFFAFGAQAGNIRTGGRFREKLTPNLFAIQRRLDVALALLGRCPFHHGRDAHAETNFEEPAGYIEIRLFLAVNHRLDRRAAQTTKFCRPGNGSITGSGFLRLPFFGTGQTLRLRSVGNTGFDLIRVFRLGIGAQPFAHFGTEFGFFGGIVKIHLNYPYLLSSLYAD